MRQPSMVRALAAMILAILLHGHVARAQEAGGEPAPLGPNVINGLVARVALYPDPLLALVLQGSTLPLQVVQATRFLEKRARDASLQPDPGWDTSIVGLLNYRTVLVMMNDDLDWTETLGTAVVNQLPDVQAAVQQVRSELQAAGTLVSNERQTVTVDADTIRIQPASPEVIYVPIYEPVPQAAAVAAPEPAALAPAPVEVAPAPAVAAEPAPLAPAPAPVEMAPAAVAAAPVAYAAPAPTSYAVPQVSYSDPYASFWSHSAAFAGGAVIGGVLGYALNDDDDDDDDDDYEIDIDEDDIDWDDVDFDEGDFNRGDIEANRSRDVNIEDSNVVIGGSRSKTKRETQLAQSQLRSNQQRKGSVSSRQATQARAQVARQPAAGTRQAEAGTRRPAATTGGARQTAAAAGVAAAGRDGQEERLRHQATAGGQEGGPARLPEPECCAACDHPAPPGSGTAASLAEGEGCSRLSTAPAGGGTAASLAEGAGCPRLSTAPGSLAPTAVAPERLCRAEPEPAARVQSRRAIAGWRTRRRARAVVVEGRRVRGGTEHAG